MSGLDIKRSNKRIPLDNSGLRSRMVRAIRETGITNVELSRRTGLHIGSISSLMNGKREGKIESWEYMLEAAGVEVGFRIKETK